METLIKGLEIVCTAIGGLVLIGLFIGCALWLLLELRYRIRKQKKIILIIALAGMLALMSCADKLCPAYTNHYNERYPKTFWEPLKK